MKIVSLIARVLLGLMFVVFGLNGFLHFLKMPPPPPGLPGQFEGALAQSGYFTPVFALQLLGGLIVLSGRYTALGLVLLGPVIVNILLFHALMSPEGILPGGVALVLFLVVLYSVRSAFSGIFQSQVTE